MVSIIPFSVLSDQTWIGTNVYSAIDEDVYIKGDCLLNLGGTRIEAVHKDVTVRLKKDVKVSSSWAGESQLYLMAAEGRTIRFVLDHDLSFVGSSVSGDDLIVVQSGPGTVEMAIAGGKTFKITSQEGSGGVQMYVLMYGGESAPCDEYCPGDEYGCLDEYTCRDEYCILGSGLRETAVTRPTLRFVTLSTIEDELYEGDTKIVVGRKSRLSFLSSRTLDMAQDSGYIVFDTSHDPEQESRMIVKVKNTGAFVVAGHFTCQRSGSLITSATIDLSIPAGHDAIVSLTNSQEDNAPSSLLFLNYNKKMPDLLADPFLEQSTQPTRAIDSTYCTRNYTGKRYGAVIGANGTLHIMPFIYLDYVGLSLNEDPSVDAVRGFESVQPNHLLKSRNASALFIDGNPDPRSTPAHIMLDMDTALFFRSGVDSCGRIRGLNDANPFTIDFADRTPGVGNILLDVEGELNVNGKLVGGDYSSKIEILSLEVAPPASAVRASEANNLPVRTFAQEDNHYLAYNSGAFLINNMMNLHDTVLSHTDVNHRVVQNNDFVSEPTYIGGERFKLVQSAARPNISFYNSDFQIHSDVAVAGVDLVVPNLVDSMEIAQTNQVNFVFYSDGACESNGNGRNLILGTRVGSVAADGVSRISADAHLDVIQLFNAIGIGYPSTETNNQTLYLKSALNDSSITGAESKGGDSIHTIFLGQNSNISIGSPSVDNDFNIQTNPTIDIAGNYFSFMAKDGLRGCPNTSNLTGKNGIFVDHNGLLTIEPCFSASFCTMITKSLNGQVHLPSSQVFFCDGVGITDWNVNLNPDGKILVPAGVTVSEYIFDWYLAKKNCQAYSPYQGGCCCAPATEENVSSLPVIAGTVDNLVIQGTRFGDPATIVVDGGLVRNISFAVNSTCCNNECSSLSGQAPVANIVLRNNGIVEIANSNLGGGGITIIADGSGVVELNSDVLVTTGCTFVTGPNFNSATDRIIINSTTSNAVRVPASGFLSLTEGMEFTGTSSLIVEPGSRILVNGQVLFSGDSQIIFEALPTAAALFNAIPHGAHNQTLNPLAVVDAADPHNIYASLINFGAGLNNTDALRVRIGGDGAIVMRNNSSAVLPVNAFVGIETIADAQCPTRAANIELSLQDNATFKVGELNDPQGGVFQVGNVSDQNTDMVSVADTSSVNFTLTIDGLNAGFYVGSQGFVGFGVGIERFDGTAQGCLLPNNQCVVPNENIVNNLFNVDSITFNFKEGRFEANRIFSGDDNRASLLAISGDESIKYNMNLASTTNTPFNMAGGTNMVLVMPGQGGIHPVVLDQDGQVQVAEGLFSNRLWVSLLASSLLQDNTLQQNGLTGAQFFDVLKVHDAVLEPNRPNTFGRADVATLGEVVLPVVDTIILGTVSQGSIIRGEALDLIGVGSESEKRQIANDVGAVFVNIDQSLNEILSATVIDN